MRTAIIENNLITTVIITPPGWQPPPGVIAMPEAQALQDGHLPAPAADPTADQLVAEGYPVEPEGCRLALGEHDRNMFAGQLVLLREAQYQGAYDPEAPQDIRDINGETHVVTGTRLRQILIGYGAYFKNVIFPLTGPE